MAKTRLLANMMGPTAKNKGEKAGKTAQTCSYRLVAVCTENCSRSNVGFDYVG